jgi:hypothetical protein
VVSGDGNVETFHGTPVFTEFQSMMPTVFCPACTQDHRIHMSESDFMDMTRNGALCNAAGEIGAQEFETIMRGEIITYLQVFDVAR